MPTPRSHADVELLAKLVLGQLPVDQAERLAVEYADDSRLAELAEAVANSNDTLLDSLRNHQTMDDANADRLVGRLIARLKGTASAASQMSDPFGETGGFVSHTAVEPAMPEKLEYFRIIKVLGQGGMGTVYLADDTRLGRKVALKTLKRELAANPSAKDRFLREARSAARLDHDHIIPIYYVGEGDGTPFLAMPFLKGEPLDDRLKREGAGDTDPADHFARAAGQRKPIPIPEALRIASEVASGLAVAHAQGLIHRDIKPANVWLEAPKGRAKILDFGLAHSQDEAVHLTASGAILGTPAYMAPEQARGKPIDARADLFSLGVMLYEMVTGQRPFTGGDTMAILTSLALDDPTPPSQVNPAVSKDLSDYILKLLEKAPEKRPADAGAVSDALVVLQMRTARPVVEALPAAAPPAPPSATAVDPWGGLDEEVPAAAPVVSRSTKAATRSAKTERVVPRAKKVAATPDGPRRGHGLKLAVAAAALFLIGGGFAAYKLVFQTKDGTLLVEVDGDADVRFKNGELQIYDADGKVKYTLKPGQRSQAVSPGNYKVVVLSADGVRLETDKFEMTKAGKVTLRVTADAAAVAKKDPKSGPPEAAGYALEFEGNEGRVELPFRGPASKAFTIEAYLTRREHPPGHALSWPLYSEPTGLSAQNGVWNFWTRQEGDGFNPTNQITSPAKNNVPTHVAGVCTGAELLLFVDGKQVASKKLDGAPIAPGRDPVALGGKYFGAMREVRVSKVARYAKTFVPASRHEPDADTLTLG